MRTHLQWRSGQKLTIDDKIWRGKLAAADDFLASIPRESGDNRVEELGFQGWRARWTSWHGRAWAIYWWGRHVGYEVQRGDNGWAGPHACAGELGMELGQWEGELGQGERVGWAAQKRGGKWGRRMRKWGGEWAIPNWAQGKLWKGNEFSNSRNWN